MKKERLIIGFIIYNDTAKYLPYLLPSLRKQSYQDFEIIVWDNSEDGNLDNREYFKKNYSDIKIFTQNNNIGYGAGYNELIKEAQTRKAEYFLAINPDMVLAENAIERLVDTLDRDKKLASVAPKIYQWDFAKNYKTSVIDTCGIKQKSALRFYDLGQGEPDRGQYDKTDILGPSGATAMYRMNALEQVKERGAYFDQNMFMYFEDCDLAYRLRLAGFKSRLVPEAIVYHDRTAKAKGQGNLQVALNRRNKNKQLKSWAFLNKHIIFYKYWCLLDLDKKLEVLYYALKMLVFISLVEQYQLKQYIKLFKIRKSIFRYQ